MFIAKKRKSQFVLLYLYATKCWERKKEWYKDVNDEDDKEV